MFLLIIISVKTKEVTTQEVEERLKLHMQKIQEQAAEEAKKINMPGYLNPAMVNVQQFKQIQDKRKLLWSKPKDKVSYYYYLFRMKYGFPNL